MLLCHQKGCRDFKEVQTIGHVLYPTYRAACEAMGLLGDDREWEIALEEACVSATSPELRSLFCHILLHCDVADPRKLWTKFWKEMGHDIPERVSDTIILSNCGKSLQNFGLPLPPQDLLTQLNNRLLIEERNYNRVALMHEKNEYVPRLNNKQRIIYDLITDASANNWQELLFMYGHGGTGKTFLWKTLISALRSEGKIVLAVASSGIASLLLPSGRTAHSRFKLPLELTEESLCRITKNTQLGKLLIDTDLIIWDEAPMNDRRCFEALDRTLRDILNAPFSLFGGKSIVLGGDFRQTLPVKKGASKMEVISSCISESELLINSFASWLLDIGDGKIGEPDEKDPENASWIDIPPQYCIPPDEEGLSNLIDFIYNQTTLHTPSATTLQQKAIVCPKNETADIINSKVLDMVSGESTTYISNDEATPTENDGAETEMLYPVEHLNTLNLPGFPPHELKLKVGAPVMLLRNVNLTGGLCNGTRMIVTQLMTKLIEVQIITGTRIGEKVFIHRISLNHKDPNLPFIFKRRQFPIKLCYAMTINKSQGQSLNKIGVYLPQSTFEASIAQLTPHSANKILEAKVYRKWVGKSPPKMTPYAFCCILLDREGNAIHANMNLKDVDYFNSKLQMGHAYRISNFICEATSRYQQTLENPVSLRFDYIGCITSVSGLSDFRDPNRKQSMFRKIDIENLNGNIVELTLWDEMARHFEQADLQNMEQPIIIAVSSCRVNKYRDFQLSATSATYYYLNPKIPEAEESRDLKAAITQGENYIFLDHGPQPGPFFRYKFKGYITDNTATAPLTFFTPAADKITGHSCAELVAKYAPADPKKIPTEILKTQGTSAIFQARLNTVGNITDLTLDDVFDVKKQDNITSDDPQEIQTGTSSPASTTTKQLTQHPATGEKEKDQLIAEQ
ncbi:DNA helicase [Tanacetum coccineum]